MVVQTQELLEGWGKWVRAGGSLTGYAQVNLVATPGADTMPDDQAVDVDRAVAKLKQRDATMGKALVNYYVRNWDLAMVGVELGVSREKARVLLRSAESWVDGCLFA